MKLSERTDAQLLSLTDHYCIGVHLAKELIKRNLAVRSSKDNHTNKINRSGIYTSYYITVNQ